MEVVLEGFSVIQNQNEIKTLIFYSTPTQDPLLSSEAVRTWTLDIYPELLSSSTLALKAHHPE